MANSGWFMKAAASRPGQGSVNNGDAGSEARVGLVIGEGGFRSLSALVLLASVLS